MQFYPSCFPCVIRQAVNALELFSCDESLTEEVCQRVMEHVAGVDARLSPPLVMQYVHRLIRETFACDDPYKGLKAEANRMALRLLPALQQRVSEAKNPLELALRYAIAGNRFDLSLFRSVSRAKIMEALEAAASCEIVGLDALEFERKVEYANRILYLADNAGEIVFDRLLIERLARIVPVTVVVKGQPVVNKATREDARMAGLERIAQVLDTGEDIPGTVVSRCSREFQACFEDAGIVLAKGQSHYETLSPAGREIFHLFMVKCATVARQLAQPVESLIFCRVKRHDSREWSPAAGQGAGKKVFGLI